MEFTREVVETIATNLLVAYDLKDWSFRFDNAKKRFGCCSYPNKTISISKELSKINSDEVIIDTLLHEIAHALTKGAGHNYVWKKKALELGATPKTCYDSKKINIVNGNYVAICPSCKGVHTKFRKCKVERSCGMCANNYDENKKLVFKKQTR